MDGFPGVRQHCRCTWSDTDSERAGQTAPGSQGQDGWIGGLWRGAAAANQTELVELRS